jgi:hypothetical protein
MSKIDHEYTDNIVCPWCGYSFEDDEYDYSDQDSHDIDCYECDKPFSVCASIEVTYSTTKEKCKNGCNYVISKLDWRRDNPYNYKDKNYCIYSCTICDDEITKTGPVKSEPYVIPLEEQCKKKK